MTFLIGGFRLTNFGDFRLTVFGQFNPTLTTEVSFIISCIFYVYNSLFYDIIKEVTERYNYNRKVIQNEHSSLLSCFHRQIRPA